MVPWWRRWTGCCEPGPDCPGAGARPFKVLHERFNPENPYLYRWKLPHRGLYLAVRALSLGLVTPYIHRIVRPDDDPDPHDHPWAFWVSVILEGGYVEEEFGYCSDGTPDFWRRRRWPGDWYLAGRHLHRIDRLFEGESWSLVFVGPKVREWGFVGRLTGCWTQWQAYVYRGERC